MSTKACLMHAQQRAPDPSALAQRRSPRLRNDEIAALGRPERRHSWAQVAQLPGGERGRALRPLPVAPETRNCLVAFLVDSWLRTAVSCL
ncbi:hypothetical protein H920_01167 [Fukomys damarensis]|uniref:Uncharacterized protein n=1 Tax=Fukomys damarensis TaxID=885580 RepID=A0A091EP23_FUKDA|nr:hypothetical protein H920_01167 [Fukomys damarensis]